MAIFTLLFQNLDFFPNYSLYDDTEGFFLSVMVKQSSKPKRMLFNKEPTFEKPGRICLCKNNIEDTKRVSMKFIPTAAFFD